MITTRVKNDEATLYSVGDAWKDIDTTLTLEEFAFMVRAVNAGLRQDLLDCWVVDLPCGAGVLEVIEKEVKKRALDRGRTMESYGDEGGPRRVYSTDRVRHKVHLRKRGMKFKNDMLRFTPCKELKEELKGV